jgi:hypothetical protein
MDTQKLFFISAKARGSGVTGHPSVSEDRQHVQCGQVVSDINNVAT